MKTKPVLIGLAVVVILSAVVAFIVIKNQRPPETVRVGVLVPLTGGAASYGQNSRKGAELAVKDFRARYPEIKVELRVEDSRGEAAAANRAIVKLIDLDQVDGIVGCVTSSATLAVIPTLNEKHVPLVSPGASSSKLTGASTYVFRTWPSDTLEAEAMTKYIVSRGIKKLALVRINNEYGLAMEAAVRSRFKDLGDSVPIVAAETFEQGVREMRTQMLRIKESGADAIYFIGFPEAAVIFGKGYSDVGLRIPVFSTSSFEDPQVPRDTGNILDGTVYTKPLFSSEPTKKFREAYKAEYGEEPGLTSDTAYDATMLILEAVAAIRADNGKVTGDAIRERLSKVRNYIGVSGEITFNDQGDVIKPVGLFVLRDKRYEELKK